MNSKSGFQKNIESIDALVKEIETVPDPALRAKAVEFLEAVMALHGAAFERVVEVARTNPDTLARLMDDQLIWSVLVLYDLHPQDMETRIRDAAAKLRARGTKVDVLSVVAGEARLQLRDAGHGCGSGSVKQAIEDAMYQAAPDLTALFIEDGASASAFVPIGSLSNGHVTPAKIGGA